MSSFFLKLGCSAFAIAFTEAFGAHNVTDADSDRVAILQTSAPYRAQTWPKWPKQEVTECSKITDAAECCSSTTKDGWDCIAAQKGDKKFSTGNACEVQNKLSSEDDWKLAMNDVNDESTAGCWGRVFGLNPGPGAFQGKPAEVTGGSTVDGNMKMLGMHDAGTGHFKEDHFDTVFGGLGHAARMTHTVGIDQQLNCGARFLDFRPIVLADGSIKFHHAYNVVNEVTMEDAIKSIQAWSANHPMELVILWMNFCGTSNDADRARQCMSLVRDPDEACFKTNREGSEWCYLPMKKARELGVPVVAGCKFPMFSKDAYKNVLTSTWTVADYKAFAANKGRRHDKMLTKDGGDAKTYKEARGGVMIVDSECMEVNAPDDKVIPGSKLAFAWEPEDGWDNGKSVKNKDAINALSHYPTAGYNTLWQVQAFWQQEATFIQRIMIPYAAKGNPQQMGPISLIALSRTSVFNMDLKASLEGKPPEGAASLKDTRLNVVSINDVCYWGPWIAEALGTNVTDDDRKQCMAKCADRAKELRVVPYMYHTLGGQKQVCDMFKHGWYDDGYGPLGETTCKWGDEENPANSNGYAPPPFSAA